MPSYQQNKQSKLWSVRFRETSPDGRIIQKRLSGFKTKKSAIYGYEDYMLSKGAINTQSENQSDDLTFDKLLEYYFKYQQPRVKPSSFYETQRKIQNKILPYFADKKMSEIKPLDILNWENEAFDGLSYSYSAGLFTCLASIYKYGEKYHDVKNIMLKVDKPRKTEAKKEMQFWTPEEFAKFLSASPDKTYSAFFALLYLTGCRRGEAEALFWEDVDTQNNTITISKNITRKNQDTPWEITTPKNFGSNRIVNIPDTLCDILKEYKQTLPENVRNKKDVFVFGGDKPLVSRTTDRYFEDTVKNAGVKKIRIHDLRHSCASLLISRGVSVVGVSRQLGHSSVQQTLNTYSHLMPDDKSKISAELEKVAKRVCKK